MTKLIKTAFFAAILLGATQANAETVRIGVEGAYPPFSSVTADGKLVGFDIDIANALCAEIGAKCELVQSDWDGIIPGLLAKKFDAIIASMSITEERKKKVAFTNKYYNTPASFARPKGDSTEVSKDSLKGKIVGIQGATIFERFLNEEFGDVVEVKTYGTQDEVYLDAKSGRIDLMMADSVAMTDGFLSTDDGKDWELFGPGYTDPKYFGEGAGIAIRKEDTALVEKFNAAIEAIRKNGTYAEINKKYFDFDVYGE